MKKAYNSNLFCDRANELFGVMRQEDIKKKTGLSQGVISAIKNYRSKAPTSDTVFKIANTFCVSSDWLLGLTDCRYADKNCLNCEVYKTRNYKLIYMADMLVCCANEIYTEIAEENYDEQSSYKLNTYRAEQ